MDNLKARVSKVLLNPMLRMEPELEPSLKTNLDNCCASYDELLILLNDKALKLAKLEDFMQQFEKLQKLCDEFLHSKRMLLGNSAEVPVIDPHSLTKLKDDVQVGSP